jgi:hypothetical protein
MKIKNPAVFILLLFVSSWLGVATGNNLQEENKKTATKQRLIRKDLLERKAKELTVPRRNIFTPDAGGGSPVEYVEMDPGEGPEGFSEQAGILEGEMQMSSGLDLRYVGYVSSNEKTIALILFQGLAVAVAKDDMISENIKIINITRETIEIIGPDAIVKKVSIEGEDR